MQATFGLCDWLAGRLPPNFSPDPWIDFSQPAAEIQSVQLSNDVGARQALYAQFLIALLEQSSVREEFGSFLTRSLAIDQEEVSAIMWEPPRALIMEVVPTLLRRLERSWRRASGPELEQHTPRLPLPEFLPRTLFSDLQVPDVAIRLPPLGANPARVESMPVAHALREFAPGRVSRRFGIAHGGERHWIPPGNGVDVSIDSFCRVPDRQDLGLFHYIGDDGLLHEVAVFRPFAIDVNLAPLDVQQSSNSFLDWRTEIVLTGEGHEVDLPDGSPWREVLQSLYLHTHNLGMPIELRRFAVGATASVGHGRQAQVVHSVQFVYSSDIGDRPAAIGFAADVDGIQVKFAYPEQLHESCMRHASLVRGLRAARFRDYIRNTQTLDGLANSFQRDWLSQAYLSALTAEALRTGATLEVAEAAVYDQTSRTTIREVLETILQCSDADPDDNNDDAHPRRLVELISLIEQPGTRDALHGAARLLWTVIDHEWEAWLRVRFKSTLGSALLEAAHGLCPRMNAGTLALDLSAHVPSDDLQGASVGDLDELWLTETIVGGGGFVEEFLTRYVEDPRRYFRLLDAALIPSDLELVGGELDRLLEMVSSMTPEHRSLAAAFEAVRSSNSHAQSANALTTMRAEFARRGIQPSATLLVSVNTRLLGPGTNAQTDRFMAAAVREWHDAERDLGVDIDARVFALVKSADSGLEQALGVTPVGDSEQAKATWRFGVLYGMLWPRGAQVRAESMRAWNPYESLPECDRLLVLATVTDSTPQVVLFNDSWFEELALVLLRHGSAELVAHVDERQRLAEALLRIGTEPVDSEALLVHARLTGVRRDGDQIKAEIDLPEAFQ
jgi:hypothetical protein